MIILLLYLTMEKNNDLQNIQKLIGHFSKHNRKYQCVILELPIIETIFSSDRKSNNNPIYGNLDELWSNILSAITETGSLWIIADDYYNNEKLTKFSFNIASHLKKNGFLLRNMIIWYNLQKQSRDLLTRYRTIIFCTKNMNYKFNLDLVREPHIWKDYEWGGGRRSRYNPKGKNPSNFWIKTKSKKGKILEHLPLSTEEVLERCFLLSAKKGEDVFVSVKDGTSLKSFEKKIGISCDTIKLHYPDGMDQSLAKRTTSLNHVKNPTVNKIFNKSSENMKEIKNNSVQLIITSPPYWGLRNYQTTKQIGFSDTYEEYLDRLEAVWSECYRTLSKSGSLWINIGKRIIKENMLLLADGVAERAEKVGFVLKDIIIWHKPVSVPTSGKANFTDRYEHILFFTKDKRNYYLNREIKDQINDYLDGPLPNLLNVWRIHRRIGNIGKKIMVSKAGKKIEHTAIYPDELVRRIIELCSQKNDLVIDPFTGSGTTVSTANKLGRKWIGYELNTSYNELISWRLKSDVIV